MFNGIGLPTPRGSGTSGYIQKNISYIKQQLKSRDDFVKSMKSLKVGRSTRLHILGEHHQFRAASQPGDRQALAAS